MQRNQDTKNRTDSYSDPYNPHPRAAKIKALKDRPEMSKSQSFLGPSQTSMKPMDRPLSAPVEQFPKHRVLNTDVGTSGLTYSAEPSGNASESIAELEVLKAIINREGYLNRLLKSAKTVSRKFKPEIADILDLLRAATLDVIEDVVKWRESKDDHDAVFMWNGVNYLLKISSDIDFLAEYRAIKNWMGFPLVRNPFCVPFPLEHGVHLFSEAVLDPKHLDTGEGTDGFVIGGISTAKLKRKYAPKLNKGKEVNGIGSMANVDPSSEPSAEIKLNVAYTGRRGPKETPAAQSFILNSDMVNIRQAELVLLKEEEKFGIHSRDPSGRILPLLQAVTRHAVVELARDNMRPMGEEATTSALHAPHAKASDVGVAETPWSPEDREEKDNKDGRTKGHNFDDSELLKHCDDSLLPKQRGESKSGGLLKPIDTKGVHSRLRRPLRPTLTSDMEFGRARKKRSLAEKLAEISRLREDLIAEKQALELEQLRQEQMSSSGTRSSAPMSHTLRKSAWNLLKPQSSVALVGRGKFPHDTVDSDVLFNGESGEGFYSASGVSGPLETPPGSPLPTHPADGSRSNRRRSSSSVSSSSTKRRVSIHSNANVDAVIGDDEMKTEEITDPRVRLQEMGHIESKTKDELVSVTKREAILNSLKERERASTFSERSRQIERRRRLLTEKQGRRRGPPPVEAGNVYDFFACMVQKTIRGWLGRCYTRWYLSVSTQASIILQAGLRGWLARVKTRRRKLEYIAARNIQRTFRGWRTRGTSAALARDADAVKAATKLQKTWRSVLGRRRKAKKLLLDSAAAVAVECIDPQNLFITDIKQLARRIQNAILEPQTTSFPPDEVLHLIRMTTMVIQESRGLLGLSEYSFINARYYTEIDGEFLTWEQAYKILNRTERFLRMVRALAFATVSKPPRLIVVPACVRILHSAQQRNPIWRIETFETMGFGSKACRQLFKWLDNIINVAASQQAFVGFLTSSFPEWLPKLNETQCGARASEFVMAIEERCIEVLQDAKESAQDDDDLVGFLAREAFNIEQALEVNRGRLGSFRVDEAQQCTEQGRREERAVLTMSIRVGEAQREFRENAERYAELTKQAALGDPRAMSDLVDVRSKMIFSRLQQTEVEAQLSLLEVQCKQNAARRKETMSLAGHIKRLCIATGEARGMYLIASSKVKAFLKENGLRRKNKAEEKLVRELEAEEERLRLQAREMQIAADLALADFDGKVAQKQREVEEMQLKANDKTTPSDEEMLEEREEDDKEAQMEREKLLQFLPDAAMQPTVHRKRPALVCLSRDLPAYAKARIHAEMQVMMPGLFVTLNIEDNMGFDLLAMQAILDSKKSIMLYIDPGMTKITRGTFLAHLEVIVKALIPNPFVVIAVGNEDNKRLSIGTPHYGVAKRDLEIMRDGDIKVTLESLQWVVDELERVENSQALQQSAEDILPPSASFLVVTECLYVLQSAEDNFFSPDRSLSVNSWRFMQSFLLQPRIIFRALRELKRGKSTLRKCEVINQYMQHKRWPPAGAQERQVIPVMHLMALFVEQWYLCETLTRQRGGVPPNSLTKGCMRGVQTVVVVSDIPPGDPEDRMVGGESLLGWRMPTARLVRACLQDLRITKTAMKIDEEMFNVSVYREQGTIYFDAYDPQTSLLYMTWIRDTQVPELLAPGALTVLNHEKAAAPTNAKEMYQQLIRLMHVGKVLPSKSARKELFLHREYVFIRNFTCKLNGHFIQLKCYEAALGQLHFKCYFPNHCASIELTVADKVRMKMYMKCDPELEQSIIETVDSSVLLPFVMDRLTVSPSKSFINALGDGVSTSHRRIVESSRCASGQGFLLKVNCGAGPGRRIYRRLVKFSGIPHVLTIRSSTYSKVLRIIAYEPRSQRKMELRMTAFVRRILTGSEDDSVALWKPDFMQRLRLIWRGRHDLHCDDTIYKVVRKIDGRRILISIGVVDETCLKIKLFDLAISSTFVSYVGTREVIDILKFISPSEEIKQTFGVVAQESLKKILWGMTSSIVQLMSSDATQVSESSSRTLEMSIEEIVAQKENIVKLAGQLELLLTRIDKSNIYSGYETKSSVDVKFLPDAQSVEKLGIAVDTSLRHNRQLTRSAHRLKNPAFHAAGSSADVISARRQPPVVVMEKELDQLAERREEEAKRRLESDLKTTEEISKYLSTFDDGFERQLAIEGAAAATAHSLLGDIEDKVAGRMEERASPGLVQAAFLEEKAKTVRMTMGDGAGAMMDVDSALLTDEQHEILAEGEKVIFESGIKVNFRDQRTRWHGHVSLKVSETMCWLPDLGAGRRLRFVVFEPSTSSYYEALIRNSRHLMEVLGVHGQDMLLPKKTTEMVFFIAKFRLFLMKAAVGLDGLPLDPEAPTYRVEFDSDRLFTADKVTPINAAGETDEEINKKKLFELEKARGTKLLRLAKRVSGLLLQLTIFEIPHVETKDGDQPQGKVIKSAGLGRHPPVGGGRGGASSLSSIAEDVNASVVVETTEQAADQCVEFAEQRVATRIRTFDPPTLRILGFDPKSKRKVVLVVPPQACLEIAGGIYSPFLDPARRRELAKIMGECLFLVFPRGRPFELNVRWTGSMKQASTALASTKMSWRSSSDRVIKRPGKLFRSALRISRIEVVVTMYALPDVAVRHASGEEAERDAAEEARGKEGLPRGAEGEEEAQLSREDVQQAATAEISNAGQSLGGVVGNAGLHLVCNFYSRAASESTEVVVTDEEQTERIGKPLLRFPDGAVRAAAARRLCRFFQADLAEDPDDMHKKILEMELMAPSKGYLSEYVDVFAPSASEAIQMRPVGVPTVFMPLDTCGYMLSRRGMRLRNKDAGGLEKDRDYVVTVYTKSPSEHPERGLVVRIYERGHSETAVLHVGASEVMRLCDEAEEPELLHDIVRAQLSADEEKLDELEQRFEALTHKGVLLDRARRLIDYLSNIVLADLGVGCDPAGRLVPFLKSSPKGTFPS